MYGLLVCGRILLYGIVDRSKIVTHWLVSMGGDKPRLEQNVST